MSNRIEMQRHVPALDGVRGTAILAVFAFHMFNWSIVPHSTLMRVFYNCVRIGWIGVDLFFVLSGFLITGNLIRSRNSQNYYQVFYFHRLLRIFPLYYLVVSLVMFLGPEHYKFSDQIWFWLNLSNIPTAFNPLLILPLAHIWSLAVEEQFYAFWPPIVRRFELKTVAIVCLCLIVGLFVLRNLPVTMELHRRYPEAVYRLTPFRIDTLCGGALLAVVVNQYPEFLQHRWKMRGLFLFSALVFIVTGIGHMPGSHAIIRLGYTSMIVAFTSLIALCLSRDGLTRRVFSNSFLRRMGSYSYCFYLIHPFLMIYTNKHPSVHDNLAGFFHISASSNLTWFVLAAIEFAIDLFICALSYRFFEQPILKLKRLYPLRAPVQPETIPS